MEKGNIITARISMITSSSEVVLTEDIALLGVFN